MFGIAENNSFGALRLGTLLSGTKLIVFRQIASLGNNIYSFL